MLNLRQLICSKVISSKLISSLANTKRLTRHDTKFVDNSLQELWKAMPKFINDVTVLGNGYQDVTMVEPWIRKILEYNLLTLGADLRAITYLSYKKLAHPRDLTPENLDLAHKVTFCIQLCKFEFNNLDDMMDNSRTRQQAPCWHTLPEVGSEALNDSLLINGILFKILKDHFNDKPYYTPLMEIFNEAILRTAIGQHLDISTSKLKGLNTNILTMDFYKTLSLYKTGYIVYDIPIRLALLMSGCKDNTIMSKVIGICRQLGFLIQAQDDYLDLYYEKQMTDKIGTDISNGRCSWLAVTALEHCNKEQFEIMKESYGRNDEFHVQRITELYDKLNMKRVFKEYEDAAYNSIVDDINKLSYELSGDLFSCLLTKIYKRKC